MTYVNFIEESEIKPVTEMDCLHIIKNAPDDDKMAHFYESLKVLPKGDDISAIKKYMVDHKHLTAKKFDDIVRNQKKTEEINDRLGFKPETLSQFVEQAFLTTLKMSQNLDGSLVKKAEPVTTLTGNELVDRYQIAEKEIMVTQNITSSDIVNELIVLNADLNLGYGERAIRAALETFLKRDRQIKKTEVMLSLTYSKDSERLAKTHWSNFEKSAFVDHEYKAGFISAVMKKFIWQVKRKTRGLTVSDHLMPIIYGEQGAGKSMMITTFLKPLNGCFKEIDATLLTDGKTNDIYDYPVLFLEELAQVQEASPEVMKKVLTGSDINNRTFQTQSTAAIKQLSTFIAATNKRVQTMIRDETGMRRYIELTMMGPTDREVLNAVNFNLLWQSVDEEAADPSLAFVHELKEIQEAMRVKSSVEEFLEDEFRLNIMDRDKVSDNKGYINTPTFYHYYENWCSSYGHKAMNKGNFAEKARSLIQFNHSLKTKWTVRKNGNSFQFKQIVSV
ncbi:VapE domain-containing protein [Acetobacter orientalis]|uniref:VapE domain-containing protein n=1 Tax=Acetobacter orientalis TaxID=146474 RepID=UPI00386D4535